jgi:hypothetical protein
VECKTDDPEEVRPLVRTNDADRMEAFAVSTYVDDTHLNGPERVTQL